MPRYYVTSGERGDYIEAPEPTEAMIRALQEWYDDRQDDRALGKVIEAVEVIGEPIWRDTAAVLALAGETDRTTSDRTRFPLEEEEE
jgi:hypothetical protein